MPSKRSIIVPLIVLVALWGVLFAVGRILFQTTATETVRAVPDKGAPPITIAPQKIVDYVEIFEGMKEAREQRALLQRLSYGQTVSSSIREKQIKAMQDSLDDLPENSPKRAELDQKLEAARKRDNAMERAEMEKFDRRQKEIMAKLFGKIETAVATVAAKHGFQAPPATSPAVPTNLDGITLADLRQLLLKRAVPLPPHAPDNLTPEVIQLLDSEYEAQKQAKTDTSDALMSQ